MRLIDADALLPMMKYATTDSEIGVFPIKIGFNTITKVIDDVPTVDAVQVIRCKDCKHYTGKWCTKYSTKQFDLNDIYKGANDFCSQAERKEE